MPNERKSSSVLLHQTHRLLMQFCFFFRNDVSHLTSTPYHYGPVSLTCLFPSLYSPLLFATIGNCLLQENHHSKLCQLLNKTKMACRDITFMQQIPVTRCFVIKSTSSLVEQFRTVFHNEAVQIYTESLKKENRESGNYINTIKKRIINTP